MDVALRKWRGVQGVWAENDGYGKLWIGLFLGQIALMISYPKTWKWFFYKKTRKSMELRTLIGFV